MAIVQIKLGTASLRARSSLKLDRDLLGGADAFNPANDPLYEYAAGFTLPTYAVINGQAVANPPHGVLQGTRGTTVAGTKAYAVPTPASPQAAVATPWARFLASTGTYGGGSWAPEAASGAGTYAGDGVAPRITAPTWGTRALPSNASTHSFLNWKRHRIFAPGLNFAQKGYMTYNLGRSFTALSVALVCSLHPESNGDGVYSLLGGNNGNPLVLRAARGRIDLALGNTRLLSYQIATFGQSPVVIVAGYDPVAGLLRMVIADGGKRYTQQVSFDPTGTSLVQSMGYLGAEGISGNLGAVDQTRLADMVLYELDLWSRILTFGEMFAFVAAATTTYRLNA